MSNEIVEQLRAKGLEVTRPAEGWLEIRRPRSPADQADSPLKAVIRDELSRFLVRNRR